MNGTKLTKDSEIIQKPDVQINQQQSNNQARSN